MPRDKDKAKDTAEKRIDKICERMVMALKKAPSGKMTRTHLNARVLRSGYTKAEIDQAIERLVREGRIVVETEERQVIRVYLVKVIRLATAV